MNFIFSKRLRVGAAVVVVSIFILSSASLTAPKASASIDSKFQSDVPSPLLNDSFSTLTSAAGCMLSWLIGCSVFCLFSAPSSSPSSGVRDRFAGVKCSGAYGGVGAGTCGGGVGAGTVEAGGATAGIVVTGLVAAADVGITGGVCRVGAAASEGAWDSRAGGGSGDEFGGGFGDGTGGGFGGGFGDGIGEGACTAVEISATSEDVAGFSRFFTAAGSGSGP